MAKPVYILNGPNLNLLGEREREVYGADTLVSIEERCRTAAKAHRLSVEFRQTNQEGDLVSWVQEARINASALIVNAAAYTHTSVALHDALKMLAIPVVEVHLSNIYRREPFRHHSYVSAVATGVICGFGARGYELALEAVAGLVAREPG